MERPGHFTAEEDYFQDDIYKAIIVVGMGGGYTGKRIMKRNECGGVFDGIPEGG